MCERNETLVLADAGIDYLASDPGELSLFLGATGYDVQGFRDALGSEELARAVLDYFASNEPVLLAMCANRGISVARFMGCWHANNRTM